MRYASIVAGANFTCALVRDGRAFCWGDNGYGQLGRPMPPTFSLTPRLVPGDHRFVALAAGAVHVCGLVTDGSVWCWGLDDNNELGTPPTGCSSVLTALQCAATPVRVASDAHFTSIAAASTSSCGVVSDGSLLCWGQRSVSGSLGTDILSVADTGGARYTGVATAVAFGCGVTTERHVRCWGDNAYGTLGTTGVTYTATPVPTADSLPRVAVTANWPYACALGSDGLAACWGTSAWGALGTQGVVSRSTPAPVDSGKHYAVLSAGALHACGVATDGSAWCWGSDNAGMLGHSPGAATCVSPFVAVPCRQSPVSVAAADAPYTGIAAGQTHTCAVTSAGTAWCWGTGGHGELGTGDTTTSRLPVQVLAPDTTP